MNKIPNRAEMCEVLKEAAAKDRDVVVLCSDSRGSGSMTSFAEQFPEQFVEVGIAEQDLVGIAAGLASCGKKAFAVSPASFISTRSYEQCKVDCAYSNTNVKLIGISGGISYGALGMSHHSAQDIAAMSAIPGMRVYLPSDRHQTRKLFEALLQDRQTAYIRVGRNPVEDVYEEGNVPFEMNRATVLREGADVLLVACGEMVKPVQEAAERLSWEGISAAVLDMYCVKPLDREGLLKAAKGKKLVVTAEEHAPFGGLGSMVAQVISAEDPKRVINLALPDAPVITGTSKEVFAYYGLTGEGIAETVRKALEG
ncbi:MAG: transketolase family protein [Clostridia bacterium]|nr:transketolase family protein [Clostridia bacterium]MBQ6720664.1 transketolase family protein [Clostridia bacterium]